MKRALALLLLAGCATTQPATKLVTTAATPPPPGPLPCPTAPGTLLDSGPVFGVKVEKVCLVGATEDGYLRLHEVVAPREGEALSTEAVRADIEALFLTGTLRDVTVAAEVMPSKNLLLTYFVTEADWISEVELTGVKALDRDELKSLARAGLRATPFVLKTIVSQVRAVYAGLGYAHTQVETRLTPRGKHRATLELVVDEGRRITLAAVRFEGPQRVPEAELRKALKSVVGAPWLEDLAERDTVALTGAYFDRGYVSARITHETRPLPNDADAVELVFKVTEGAQFRLGKLSLSGFSIGPEAEVLKGLESKPRAVFSRAMLQRDIERLRERARQRGNDVEVTPLTDVDVEKKRVDVKLELERVTGGNVKF